jgi:hypothetical protein
VLFALSISTYRKTRINALSDEVKDFAVNRQSIKEFFQFAERYRSDNKQDRGWLLASQKRSI